MLVLASRTFYRWCLAIVTVMLLFMGVAGFLVPSHQGRENFSNMLFVSLIFSSPLYYLWIREEIRVKESKK